MAFAEPEFRRMRLSADGATQGEHDDAALAIWAKLGRRPKLTSEDDASLPECPAPIAYLWQFFCEILLGCQANGFSPKTIGWGDLSSWCDLTGTALEHWERMALIELSALRAEILSEQAKT